MTSQHQRKYAMNMVFCCFGFFRALIIHQSVVYWILGDQPSRDGTYKPDWILLNAF